MITDFLFNFLIFLVILIFLFNLFTGTSIEGASWLSNVIMAFIAIRALDVWKIEIRGRDKYSISKEVINKSYKIQDKINSVRHPFVSSIELSQRTGEESHELSREFNEERIKDEYYALHKRIEPLLDIANELKSLKFDVQALFEIEGVENIQSLIQKVYRLKDAQDYYTRQRISLERNSLSEDRRETIRDEIEEHRKVVYFMGAGDELMEGIKENIIKIENYFKPFLSD